MPKTWDFLGYSAELFQDALQLVQKNANLLLSGLPSRM